MFHNIVILQANAVIDMIGFPAYIKNKTRLDKEYNEVRNIVMVMVRPVLRGHLWDKEIVVF